MIAIQGGIELKIITSTKETKWKEKEAEVVSCDEELDSVTVCETDRKVVWDGDRKSTRLNSSH